MSTPNAVAFLVERLKAGDNEAAQLLWNDYFPQVVALARKKLRSTSRRVADEEDVALSAFDSFCRAAARGRLPELKDRDNLWALFARITIYKVADLLERNLALKRGGGQVRGDSALAYGADNDSGAGFDGIEGSDLTPSLAAMLADEVEHSLKRLEDPSDPDLRKIAVWKMEGDTNAEIAGKLGCSVPTVERRLRLIRTLLKKTSDKGR